MSYAVCRRAAVLAVSGLFVGLPLVVAPVWAATTSTAAIGQSAAEPEEDPDESPDVSFSSGGLLCGSSPTTSKITVGAETKVKLTNRLGQNATLRVDGQDRAEVSDGEKVDLRFHRGPVSVAMVPECMRNLDPTYESLTVEVTRRHPGGLASPTVGATASSSPTPGPSPSPSPRPSSSPVAGGGAGSGSRGATDNNDTHSSSGSNPTGGGNGAPTSADLPSVPPDPFAGELGDGMNPESGATVGSVTVIDSERVSNQSLRGSSVPIDSGPIGLLSIIATVCVVGVSAGAIRAIIAQRATRAEFA